MSDTRFYGNKKRTLWVAPDAINPFADASQATASEVNAMLNISSVVKWDSTDLAVQDSDKIDDRVLTDSAGAQRRGFVQFGGGLNLLSPRDIQNVADVAVKAFALLKTQHSAIWVVDRIGPSNSSLALAGQRVNIYKVAIDAKKNQTSGDTSYSYTIKLVPQGDVYANYVLAGTPALQVTTQGHSTTMSLATVRYTWGTATIATEDITTAATWSSSSPAVATVDSHGLVTALSTGTTNITAGYPGATTSTPIAITVA